MISEETGWSENLLHIHCGLALFILARLITRYPYHSFIPFLCVVAIEAGNELLDYLLEFRWRPEDTFFDIINTLFWPLMISLSSKLSNIFLKSDTNLSR